MELLNQFCVVGLQVHQLFFVRVRLVMKCGNLGFCFLSHCNLCLQFLHTVLQLRLCCRQCCFLSLQLFHELSGQGLAIEPPLVTAGLPEPCLTLSRRYSTCFSKSSCCRRKSSLNVIEASEAAVLRASRLSTMASASNVSSATASFRLDWI